MAISRRGFLGGLGVAAAGAALAPLIKVRRAFGDHSFSTHKIVIVAIGGGLRNREALGMAEGATMPNLMGDVPLIDGFGAGAAGAPIVAPEYAAMVPELALPSVLSSPLHEQGTLITNLRYAEGAPGHLQGHACLLSGYYNNIENRSDARLPVPTMFELHRRATDMPATDTWYLSVPGGFYRALQASNHPEFGARYGGSYISPPGVLSPIVPITTSGQRELDISGTFELPIVPRDEAADAAVGRLTAVLDGNSPRYAVDRSVFRSTVEENQQIHAHLAEIFGDSTYQAFFPDSFGIGTRNDDGGVNETQDALTTYHAEQILQKFQPTVLAMSLLDIDTCHSDFNGYLRGQQVADACVTHLWNFIQSTEGLAGETTMLVLPEHGRHLFMNGQNPDSYGRSGIDHGLGDDGDRDVWMLALGPDIEPGQVIAPTGITQPGRNSGRYETIDVIMSAMTLLGHGDTMKTTLEGADARPGLVIEEMLR
jgi:hypothetical protein